MCSSFWIFSANTHLSKWGTCRNGVHCRNGVQSKWGTCAPFRTRFLAVYSLNESFLSKVKGRNDRGIIRIFHIFARVSPKIEIWRCCWNGVHCRNGIHVPHSVGGFFLSRWERLNSKVYAYYPWAGRYVNYQNKKKRGSFYFEAVPLSITRVEDKFKCR